MQPSDQRGFSHGPFVYLGHPVFNRTLPLKDAWAKIEKKTGA
jgi:hypothetical protein